MKGTIVKHIANPVALMLAWLLTAVLATIDSAAAFTPSPYCGAKIYKSSGKAWRCTFAEEFSGSALDRNRWMAATTAKTNVHGNGDCWVDSPNNIAVSSGVLRLTTRMEAAPFTCKMANGNTYEANYTSGSVSTWGKFSQTYGRWDIKARFPQVTTPGSQGILWLYPVAATYGAWPKSGEIDIAEFYSKYPDRAIPYIHYLGAVLDVTVTNNYCLVTNPWDFHIYSTVWVSGRITISIDGKMCVDHVVLPALPLLTPKPFDKPFDINLSQALGVGTNSVTADTPMPLTTEVDWVHVWS